MIKQCSLEELTRFEKLEGLFDREYNGFPYWESLRFEFSRYFNSNYVEIGKIISKNIPLRHKIRKILSKFLYGVFNEIKILFMPKQDFDFIYFKSNEGHERFYKYWDSERGYKIFHLSHDRLKGEYNLCWPYFVFSLKYHFLKSLGLLKRDEDEYLFLQKLEKRTKEAFGRSMPAEEFERYARIGMIERQVYEKYFRKLFRKVHAKAIVVVCYYQGPLYAAYRVCKEKGVDVIEFQHGSIIDHNMSWFEDQRGVNNEVPDYMLTFGEMWTRWTKLLRRTKVVPVGNPFQEYQIKHEKNVKTDEKAIIIYPTPAPEFETVINEFTEMAIHNGYKVYVKIHPGESNHIKEYYPLLSRNPNLTMVTDQSKSVYYWLRFGRHQVFTSTTVVLESVAIEGRNVCVATDFPHRQGQPLLNLGIARGFSTAKELLALIENPLSGDMGDIKEGLWKSDASVNVRKFFDEYKENKDGRICV